MAPRMPADLVGEVLTYLWRLALRSALESTSHALNALHLGLPRFPLTPDLRFAPQAFLDQ